MSNSPLVNYVDLNNHYYGARNRIDKITIHHMAGNMSVEACGNLFHNKEGSSNYGIGTDGRVALYVEEKYGAWTSNSQENDMRAVTIEVANCNGAPNWEVSDTAFNKLIDLCVDICQRNGIPYLNWTGDANGNLTIHKMFHATACPGPYLESRMPEIANLVNARLGGQPAPTPQPVSNEVNVFYRVKTAKHGWLPEVKNLEDYAGYENSPIVDVMVRVDRGSVWYQAHVLGGGWLGKVTGYDVNDFNNGYAGDDKNPIDALKIYYQTPQDIINSSGYKRAKYNSNYGWQYDNETSNGQDGYVGVFGHYMTELRVEIV